LVIFYALELDTMVMYHITDWSISWFIPFGR
jgi:hypothetical protein